KELDHLVKRLRTERIAGISATGHTDDRPISARLQRLYPDNYSLSRARASSVGDYLAQHLNLAIGQMSVTGKGPDEPVAGNDTENGRSQNRRVELRIVVKRTVVLADIVPKKESSGARAVATLGLRPGEEWPQEKKADLRNEKKKNGNMPEYGSEWLASAGSGFELLWPPEGYAPIVPSTRAAVKHDPRRSVKLLVNGSAVDAIYFDGTQKRQDESAGVSTWRGIALVEGDNRFEAREYDAAGTETNRIVRVIHYAGPPASAEVVPAQSQLVADGKRPVVIAVRLSDKDGRPAREGMLGDFTVDPPYLTLQRTSDLQQSPLIASTNERTRYTVGEDGTAVFELQPTNRSGEAVLRLSLADGVHDLRVWLKPEERDWILVGLAEGTYGYNVVTGNMESLAGAGQDERYYDEGRVAFYAKGRVRGEWLLTMAYDSAKQTPDNRQGLYQTIDPNKYYLLYGDGTEQRYDAPSSKKIYLKLERDQFYALFGDYAAGLSMTELSKYTRNLTGFKSEMKTDHFEYNVFASETNQSFVKDEIRGDGTSGLYHLSRKNIVLNSDQVTIEVRDRFRSEVILSRQTLARYLDYTIDYDAGTLWFKSPVFSRDENFNPTSIVAEYEAFDASDRAYTYGGRGAVKLFDNKAVIGATRVHEGRTGGGGDLSGVDATVNVSKNTVVRAEAATTRIDQAGNTKDGSAYLAEVQHRSENLEGKAYFREQGSDFGLGQQNGSETGTRKIGGDILYRISTPWSFGAEIFRQETLSTGATRDLAELRGKYTMPTYDVLLGVRHAEDSPGTGQSLASDQIYVGGRYQFTERLAGRVRHDQSLGSGESIDFPTRTTLGLDFKLNNTATLFADQEFTRSSAGDTGTSRVGVKASPWTGGQLSSTMEQQTTEYGARLFSTMGLKQSWQITKQWTVDGGLDRTSTIRHSGNPTLNVNVPPASGSTEDFTAVSLGAGYRQERWSWTGRVESRTAESEDKFSTFTGVNGELGSGLAMAAGLQTFHTEAASGLMKFSGDLRIGAAYRPLQTRFIVLDRFDLLKEEQRGSDFSYDNWRVINNYVMNFKYDHRAQLSFQYAAKFVKETIEQNDYRGYTDLAGLEGRYDLSTNWDIGLRGLMLHSWSIDQTSYGAGASVGFSAVKNVWISLGYNISGFTDRDFSKADFTA
ncbi:MAG TPA: OmpA family protein, partial [Nitrospirota bacterium]